MQGQASLTQKRRLLRLESPKLELKLQAPFTEFQRWLSLLPTTFKALTLSATIASMRIRLAKVIALAVQLILLACVLAPPVSAKTALGGYQPNYEVALADVAAKSLSVLDNYLSYKTKALGCCVGPEAKPSGDKSVNDRLGIK